MYPDYYEEIKNPISLLNIRKKIRVGHKYYTGQKNDLINTTCCFVSLYIEFKEVFCAPKIIYLQEKIKNHLEFYFVGLNL